MTALECIDKSNAFRYWLPNGIAITHTWVLYYDRDWTVQPECIVANDWKQVEIELTPDQEIQMVKLIMGAV